MNLKDLCIAFGSTETGPVSFMSRITDNEDIRCETVGRVMPNTECIVVDEQQRVVPVGTIGELYVRGYLTMNGYWNAAVVQLTVAVMTTSGSKTCTRRAMN